MDPRERLCIHFNFFDEGCNVDLNDNKNELISVFLMCFYSKIYTEGLPTYHNTKMNITKMSIQRIKHYGVLRNV